MKLTEAEWPKGVEFLTQVGQFCAETRQEFIALSDVLGLEMTVIELNHSTADGATEATWLRPFYISDAPELAKGAAVCGDPPGEPLDVMGEVQDLKSKPIANALIDVWQAGDDGLYSSQDPQKQKFELRGRFRSDRDGAYHFKSVMPKGYQIPSDCNKGDVRLYIRIQRPDWRTCDDFGWNEFGIHPLRTRMIWLIELAGKLD